MIDDDPNSSRRPPEIPVLDYSAGRESKRLGPPMSGQVSAGFFIWVASVVLVYFIFATFPPTTNSGGVQIVVTAVLAVIAFSLWMHLKLGWRLFAPGVLLGFGLTCLLPLGIAAALCGNWKI
jgi:hypothetical protein